MYAANVEPKVSTVEPTFIERHRWLTLFFGASHPVYSYLSAVPLIALFALIGAHAHSGLPEKGVLVAAGILYWTFIEYAMHRFLYHWRPPIRWLRQIVESFHIYHHRNVPDRSVYNAGPLLALPLAAILAVPIFVITQNLSVTALVMTGTVAGYCVYEWFHHAIHVMTPRRGWLKVMQTLHLHHHRKNASAYYGVTNPFWDYLFATRELAAKPDALA